MVEFVRGQKGKLADMGCTGAFPIILKIAKEGMDVDIACFGLDVNDQLSDDRYMVFYNQKSSPGGEVALEIADGKSTFTTDVSRLPDTINKLVFAASIGGEGTMRKLGSSSMHLGSTAFLFSGADFQNEKAVIIGEIYKRDGQWRFGAVGQGFNGGLSSLLKHFGGTEVSGTVTPVPVPSITTESKKMSLNKITLEKRGDKVSLEKIGTSTIRVKLNWTKSVDLDLHAFFKTKSGKVGHVYFADKGNLDKEPYILLDADAGVGNTAGNNEENLKIVNLDTFSSIIIATNIFRVFGFMNDGDNFARYDGKVIVQTDAGYSITVPLISEEKGRWCVIAKIDNSGNVPIVINVNNVQKEEPRLDVLTYTAQGQ